MVRIAFACFGLFLFVMSAPASAQPGVSIRGGVSVRPTLVWFGANVETGSLAHISFRPGLDFGLGEQIALAANFELIGRVAVPRRPAWSVYFGGGTSAILASGGHRIPNHVGYVGGGTEVVFGIQRRNGVFADVHVSVAGVDAVPVRVSVGYVVKSFIK